MSNDSPDFNPFASTPQPQKAAPEVPSGQPFLGRPVSRQARLGFFACFFEAKNLLGRDYWQFWGLSFVGMFIAGAIPLVLAGPIYCGLGYCFLAVERRQTPSFELMFKGFDEFMNTLIPTLLFSLFMLLVVPLYVGGVIGGIALCSVGEPVTIVLGVCAFVFGVLSLVIGFTFVGYGSLFACFLVAEYKLEGMDAFKVSLEGIRKNFFGIFGVMIASMIVGFCAILLCYIPWFLMLPIFMGAPFICYRKIFVSSGKGTKQQQMVFPT